MKTKRYIAIVIHVSDTPGALDDKVVNFSIASSLIPSAFFCRCTNKLAAYLYT